MRYAVLVLAGLLLVGAPALRAQPAAKVGRIGFISPLAGSPEPPTLRAFRQGLRELGHVEGKTVLLETRFWEGREERLPELLADLLGLKVDVLVVGATTGVLAAKRATKTVPIVFAGVGDPLSSGIVASLARPEGNITGVTFGVGGLGFGGKWVEVLKEAVPIVSHVALLANPSEAQTAPLVQEVHAAARNLKVKLTPFDAVTVAGLDRTLAGIGASGAQAIIVSQSPLFAANRAKLIDFAAAKRLPAIYFFRLFPDSGGLMSYGGSTEESYRRAATFVDKILKGAKPADLPIEQPTRIELVINSRTAKALGLTIPPRLLLRADHVIE
jgi:putative ABC transport system substrate-binding protein